MGRLAMDRVVVEAFRLPWTNRRVFARALGLPALAMVLVYAGYWWFYEHLDGGMRFVVFAADKLLWIVFAVCCHRVVLLALPRGERVRPGWGRRETVFAGFALLLLATGWLVAMPIMTVLVNAGALYSFFLPRGHGDLFWATWGMYTIAAYIWARLSPVFPATAIDAHTSVTGAWSLTRNNGLRMMVLVFALPAGMNVLTDLLSREDATFVEALMLRLLLAVALAVEVTALSVAYRELTTMHGAREEPA
jgi:hypothetical protein